MKSELTKGRDFAAYEISMDAAIEQKLRDIRPWIKKGLIVDAGFGSGLLLKRLSKEMPTSQFVGLDISSHFTTDARTAFQNYKNIKIIKGDITARHFKPNSVSTKIFAAVLHEIYSYNGYSKCLVRRALRNTFDELESGGRVIIRDGIKPQNGTFYVRFNSNDGLNNSRRSPKFLSTQALFERFACEFRQGQGVRYCKLKNGLYKMEASALYEFLSKKEYRINWRQEVNEQFGYFRLKEYENLLRQIGFSVIYAKSYTNPWILENWWRKTVQIYKYNKKKKLMPAAFPHTNLVLVGEKNVGILSKKSFEDQGTAQIKCK